MQPQAVRRALAELDFEFDARNPPDEWRRRQFRLGWDEAVGEGQPYGQTTLKRLSWNNLGYRLGKRFGSLPQATVDLVFDVLAEEYHRRGREESTG